MLLMEKHPRNINLSKRLGRPNGERCFTTWQQSIGLDSNLEPAGPKNTAHHLFIVTCYCALWHIRSLASDPNFCRRSGAEKCRNFDFLNDWTIQDLTHEESTFFTFHFSTKFPIQPITVQVYLCHVTRPQLKIYHLIGFLGMCKQ